MVKWPPERSTLLLLVCVATAGDWLIRSLLGHNPGDGLLGFSGTCLLAWSTVGSPSLRRHRDEKDEEEDEAEEASRAAQASEDTQL